MASPRMLAGPLRTALSLRSKASSPVLQCLCRHYRIRPGVGLTADERDDRLLKHLETQLAQVKAKIKREEEEAEQLAKKYSKSKGGDPFEGHNIYFWEKVLTPEDRKQLAVYGIKSIDELYKVYEQAEAILAQPSQPKFENLDRKHQYAHELYNSIPKKIADSKRDKDNSLGTAFRSFKGWY